MAMRVAKDEMEKKGRTKKEHACVMHENNYNNNIFLLMNETIMAKIIIITVIIINKHIIGTCIPYTVNYNDTTDNMEL